MNFKRFTHLKLPPEQYLRKNIHKYATVCETNDTKNVGKRLEVQGWVRALRKMKNNIFLDVNDGTSSQHLQVVLNKNQKPENLNYGCSIVIEGQVAQAPNGRAELQAENIQVIGNCDLNEYPFLPRKQYESEYVRQFLHLRPRTRTFSSIMRLRSLASDAIRDHFSKHNFINVDTPIITSNDCEGAGEIFNVQPNSHELLAKMKKEGSTDDTATYFNTKTFLSVSGQLHLEACARALSKVYNFCPAFRAENSKSRLHLSEFYMIEAELAFMTSVRDLANEAELLVKSTMLRIIEKGALDLKFVQAPEPAWLNRAFGFITYQEALDTLNRHADKLAFPIKQGENFAKEHELFLVQHYGNVPVFIVDWPKECKPFYMQECDYDNNKVKALDLLVPTVGELIGGSVREDNYVKLKDKLPCNSNLDWYLQLRKYGNVPTAGFGMGFERFLQFILGVPNIKDVIPFPRWPYNCNL
ncbi:probable asparagine--tRNA ligase, mitochondrial [Trichogramma pretiosum]|uniref:probable asparagine--tRNA ligase, mitochondrial n=1 Tax=Trichogramma pretiosum TaxID=7493 RepID=UPI0006C991F4|nr:probable asparagine--tRNA ligase, mitochondrial [Trichogramma pretiosum]